jgi:adenine deaminase
LNPLSAPVNELFGDVRAAQALAPVDLILENCRLVNVCSGEIHPADIAIRGSNIVAVREKFDGAAAKTLDCAGSYAIPGFIQVSRDSLPPSSPSVSTWIVTSSAENHSRPGGEHHFRRIHAPQTHRHLAGLRICTTFDEAVSALRSGATVFVEPHPSTTPGEILSAMRASGIDTSRICLCLPQAPDVVRLLHAALQNAFTAPEIFQMLSLNPARHFALDHEIGSIAPSRRADILLTKSLDPFEPLSIVFDGKLVFHEGLPCT